MYARWLDQSIFSKFVGHIRHKSLQLLITCNTNLISYKLLSHRDQFWDLCYFLYINDIKHAIGCDNVKLFADDTFLFTNDRNIYAAKEKASNLFEKIPAGVLQNNYRLTARRQILCSFVQRISRFRNTLIVYRQHFLPSIELNLSNI